MFSNENVRGNEVIVMKVLGWIMYAVGVTMVYDISDGFWLPFIGIMMIAIGVLLARGERW